MTAQKSPRVTHILRKSWTPEEAALPDAHPRRPIAPGAHAGPGPLQWPALPLSDRWWWPKQESSLNEVPQPPGLTQACASNSAPVTRYITAPFSPPMWRTATGPMTDKELAVGSRPGLVTL